MEQFSRNLHKGKKMLHIFKGAQILMGIGIMGLALTAHTAAPVIPPQLVEQAKNLSPSAQRALAKQYGVELDAMLGRDDLRAERKSRSLGAPGEPLKPPIEGDGVDEELATIDMYGLDKEEEIEKAAAETELKRFGENLFDVDLGTFAPVDNIPVPEGYRLGVGDELTVMIIGKETAEHDVLLGRDGSVTLPKLGRLSLVGLTFSEAKKMLETRVQDQLIGSEVLLSMGSLRSINVFMAGEVKQPGSYSVSALTTLSQVIFIAGGITDGGSYRNIQLKRKGETVATFDIYDLLIYGDNSGDVRLQSGDVVLVSTAGPQLSVRGEVLRPAIYEFNPGDTIATVLKMAGGKTARGYSKQARLSRYLPGESLPSILNINLQNAEQMSLAALDGDELSIRPMSDRYSNPIAIEGPTELESVIGWSKGLRVIDVFNDLEGDLKPTADLDLSLVVRRKNSLNDIQVLPFSLGKATADASSPDNLTLRPFDRIVILPLPSTTIDQFDLISKDSTDDTDIRDLTTLEALVREKEAKEVLRKDLIEPIVLKLKQQARSGQRAQVVQVDGAVQLPGEYPLLGGGSIGDLIKLAGGFTDDAYLERAEIRRISLDHQQNASISFINIELNNEPAVDYRLLGRDTLRINRIPNWSTNETVTLSGEFLFPGKYTVSEGETIAGLISRAGGFTDDAFLKGAQYISATARKMQSEQLKKIYAGVERRIESRKAAGEYTSENSVVPGDIDQSSLGRVSIDLLGIVAGNETVDMIVESGDTLFVPKFSNTIAVVGEVYEPGTFKHEIGNSLQDYVRTAGGETEYALSKRVYVLKSDGTVRFSGRRGVVSRLTRFEDPLVNKIEPGDVIVVPTNLDYDRPLERVSAITNVVFQSLTSVAAFLSIARSP